MITANTANRQRRLEPAGLTCSAGPPPWEEWGPGRDAYYEKERTVAARTDGSAGRPAGLIFAMHRDLPLQRGGARAPDCPGRMIVLEQGALIWEVRCDTCGEEIGVPPRQWKAWTASAGAHG